MGATLNPADFKSREIEATVIPLPTPEMTPPETKIYFVGMSHNSKKGENRQGGYSKNYTTLYHPEMVLFIRRHISFGLFVFCSVNFFDSVVMV